MRDSVENDATGFCRVVWIISFFFQLRVSFLNLGELTPTNILSEIWAGPTGVACFCFKRCWSGLVDWNRRIQDVFMHTTGILAKVVSLPFSLVPCSLPPASLLTSWPFSSAGQSDFFMFARFKGDESGSCQA